MELTITEAAYGIYAIANAKMSRMVKAMTTQRGRDPRDYAMVAFGGCGPGHAVAIAEELGLTRVIVPPWAGLFSSLGLHMADVEQYRTWTYWRELSELDLRIVNLWFQQAEEETTELMRLQGIAVSHLDIQRFADMRYSGQGSELTIAVPPGKLNAEVVESLKLAFNVRHKLTYGYSTAEPVEVFRLRLVTRSKAKVLETSQYGLDRILVDPSGPSFRDAYFGPRFGWKETPVMRGRSGLSSGPAVSPLIVEEYDATTVVSPGWTAQLDAWGSIVLERSSGT